MISIVIIEDHNLVRQGLCNLIKTQSNLEVVGEAGLGKDGVAMVMEKKPDVLLLDLDLPDMSGLEVIDKLDNVPDMKTEILILTMHESVDMAVRMMKAGASGYVCKNNEMDELIKAINMVSDGDIYLAPTIKDKVLKIQFQGGQDTSGPSSLSNRETLVLLGIANGESLSEIADRLCLSEGTIKSYKRRITQKTGLVKPVEILLYCQKHGLIKS